MTEKPSLPIVSADDVRGKVVLIRVDHNAIKKGKLDDPYRLERSRPTIDLVLSNGGYPILMTHVNRPRDKETGKIKVSEDDSVAAAVEYIESNWKHSCVVAGVDISHPTDKGFTGLDKSVDEAIDKMKAGKVDIVYLPNTRWFAGEEEKSLTGLRERFTAELASIADIFVNDAFGSHQAHVSTYDITKKLPSFAGLLMAEEIEKLEYLLNLPAEKHPFLSIVAGAKMDTKIGALESLREVSDNLLVGGLPANALICAKYGVKINGVKANEIKVAKRLLAADTAENKLLIPDLVVASDVAYSKDSPRQPGGYREVDLTKVHEGDNLGFVYDISPNYFERDQVKAIIGNAKTAFTNAVMGFDKAGFTEGTIAMYNLLAASGAELYFGGGDTLKALKKYTSDFYKKLITSKVHTMFTGGGTILTGFESKGVYKMKVIKALIDNGGKKPN